MRRLFFYGVAIVTVHFVLAVWHLFVLSRLDPALGKQLVLFVGAMNILPFVGLTLLWNGSGKLAAWFLLVPFGMALAFGGYSHFVSSGPDNVFQMASGPWTRSYQVSATLLALLEIFGCWIAIAILASSQKNAVEENSAER